ncbi:12323_t:CDS:2 [Entrophospora sp. SA101]|nr:12323_t:CDS:2 [Entrophospora sp. SA101]
MGRIHKKYYSANATFLSDEAIQEIKGSPVVVNYIENCEREQQMNSHIQNSGNVFSSESESELIKITERILNVLGEVWSNLTFATSTSRNQQSEGTYITDVVVPLLRAGLGNLPNGYICLSTAERQSLATRLEEI